jgi:hypothetical protein
MRFGRRLKTSTRAGYIPEAASLRLGKTGIDRAAKKRLFFLPTSQQRTLRTLPTTPSRCVLHRGCNPAYLWIAAQSKIQRSPDGNRGFSFFRVTLLSSSASVSASSKCPFSHCHPRRLTGVLQASFWPKYLARENGSSASSRRI